MPSDANTLITEVAADPNMDELMDRISHTRASRDAILRVVRAERAAWDLKRNGAKEEEQDSED